MSTINLTILSYHRFTAEDNDYVFSRTYKQFQNDLNTKDFDWITMDDAHRSIVKACKMMQDKNFRAKIFTSTALIGTPGYCSWDDLWRLSRFHDIENHSHNHVRLTELSSSQIYRNMHKASVEIKKYIGITPRYFVAPWNTYNQNVIESAERLGLQIVVDRIDIRNDSR